MCICNKQGPPRAAKVDNVDFPILVSSQTVAYAEVAWLDVTSRTVQVDLHYD